MYLFIKDGSFPLKAINCNYAWARGDENNVDFDQDDSFLEIYNQTSDNDNSNSSDNEEQATSNCINYFTSSVCYDN